MLLVLLALGRVVVVHLGELGLRLLISDVAVHHAVWRVEVIAWLLEAALELLCVRLHHHGLVGLLLSPY